MPQLTPLHPIEGVEAFELKPGRLIVVRCPPNMPRDVRLATAEDLAAQVEGTGVTVVLLPRGFDVEAFLALDARTAQEPVVNGGETPRL